MEVLIKTVEELKRYVKLNAVTDYGVVYPFLADATCIYIVPNVGEEILGEAVTDETLREYVCRALGPLSMALATDEMGLQYGDAGITVQNVQGQRSPANDTKIAAAKENLMFRGMQALDRLLAFLAAHPEEYPGYQVFAERFSPASCLIRSAAQYQDEGMVFIDYSTMSFRTMLPLLMQIQHRHVAPLLGKERYALLLSGDAAVEKYRLPCVRFMAAKCAELHTSQAARSQRLKGSQPEFEPLIRPAYSDLSETGNYYAEMASFWLGEVNALLDADAEAAGEEAAGGHPLDWNSQEKKLFAGMA